MNTELKSIILLVRKYSKWLLAVFFCICLIYFTVFYSSYHYFQSDSTIIINADVLNISSTNFSLVKDEQIPVSNAENRLMMLFNSNALRDSLMYRLDLINHYNIKKDATYRYERTLKKMAALIQIKKIDNSTYKITVKDKVREMASNIANDIPRLINVINKDLMMKNISTKVLKYQTLIDTLEKQNVKIQKTQYAIVEKFSPEDRRLVEFRKFFDNAMSTLKGINENNIQQIESYKMILSNQKQINLNAVTVLNKAYPDNDSGYDILGVFTFCIYALFGIISLFILSVVFYNSNKQYIRLLFLGEE